MPRPSYHTEAPVEVLTCTESVKHETIKICLNRMPCSVTKSLCVLNVALAGSAGKPIQYTPHGAYKNTQATI